MKCCQSKSCRWLLGLRPGNSIIVFEIILTDVIADLHTAHHMPPGTRLIVSSARPLIETRITPSTAESTHRR